MRTVRRSNRGAGLALLLLGSTALTAWAADMPQAKSTAGDKALIERGRYIALIGGCNDCHTAKFAETGGMVPESAWLEGDAIGFLGPWGTTYPINLRQYVANMTADQFVATMGSLKTRPPMPWWSLQAMTETDRRALYAFLKSLGPSSHKVPAALPPGNQAKTPVISWPGM